MIYQPKLAPGKRKRHKGGASRSAPHGLEYQRGTSRGSLFHDIRRRVREENINTIVILLDQRMIVFLCKETSLVTSFFTADEIRIKNFVSMFIGFRGDNTLLCKIRQVVSKMHGSDRWGMMKFDRQENRSHHRRTKETEHYSDYTTERSFYLLHNRAFPKNLLHRKKQLCRAEFLEDCLPEMFFSHQVLHVVMDTNS